jgi:hypothetical protein
MLDCLLIKERSTVQRNSIFFMIDGSSMDVMIELPLFVAFDATNLQAMHFAINAQPAQETFVIVV